MPNPKKPHPADTANADTLARAMRFDVTLFLGAGRYARASAPTLAEAEAEATQLANTHATTAKPLIYGITAEGRSALVTSPLPRGWPATYASRFNAQRGARSVLGTAAVEGRDFSTVQSGTGWTWTPLADPKTAEAKTPELATQAEQPPADVSGKAGRGIGRSAALLTAAQAGRLPPPPDFSAPTHARFRAKLAALVAMAEAADLPGLKAVAINPISTSPKALARYRDLAVIAIEARRAE